MLLQNVAYITPTTGNNIDLRFCYGNANYYWSAANPKPRLLCNENNETICDTTYTITVKSAMFNLTRSLIISTSSTNDCVPKLTRQ